MTHEDSEVCLDCNLTDAVCDLLEAGADVAHVWEMVKDAIEGFEEEKA